MSEFESINYSNKSDEESNECRKDRRIKQANRISEIQLIHQTQEEAKQR